MQRVFCLLLFLVLVGCQQGEPSPSGNSSDPPGDEPPPVTGRWSDPASWPQGRVPERGDAVTILEGKTILLDVSKLDLASLTVEGALVFSDERDIKLRSDWIMVRGRLQIGSVDHPHQHEVVITLTDHNPGGAVGMRGRMGDKVLGVMGGVLELHGSPRVSWTKLAATAKAGAAVLTLAEAVDWQVGDKIVIALTDFDFEQAQELAIIDVEGKRVEVFPALEYSHYGELQRFGGHTLDERAEVGLLSRNIVIQGTKSASGFGGHLMAMGESTVRISNVEFRQLGQAGISARYPVHFHLMQDASRNSYVVNSSIHHNYQRCLTIHGSNGVRVAHNVAFDTYGHCFFLEDGSEIDNVFEDNLALGIKEPEEEDALLASDVSYLGPAAYWITNPDNVFRNNVAAGSAGSGFWFALPEHPTGLSAELFPSAQDIWPRFTPLAEFSGNVSHSNQVDGLHIDNGPNGDEVGDLETVYYRPSRDPNAIDKHGRNESASVTTVFESFTAYKNRNRGAWLRGYDHVLKDATFADNAIGVTFASSESFVKGSVFIGETANLGTPQPWEATGEAGRSLPKPWHADLPIRGFEFYDGRVGVKDSYFAEFSSDSVREAAALSYLDFTDFSVDPGNFAAGLEFAPGTNRVYLATRPFPTPSESCEDVSDCGEDGYRSAVFLDSDGSVTGSAGHYVTVNNPFLLSEGCSYRDNWNAHVCDVRYVSLILENEDDAPQEIAPVILQRSDGVSHQMIGTPDDGPNTRFRSIVRLDDRYRYELPITPDHLRLHLNDAKAGDWLSVSLPYAGSEVYIYRDWWIDERNLLTRVSTMDELVNSTGDQYLLSGGTLHLKMQVKPGETNRDWAVLDVCRYAGCK